MDRLTVGTRIYYGGDRANAEGFGTVTKSDFLLDPATATQYDIKYDIKMDDGREFRGIYHIGFSPEYLGHGGTRFVTEQAYNDWKARRLADLHNRFGG